MSYHLAHPLTTPLGEYRAGLEVWVTSRCGDTVTINVSPSPLAARLITVDRRMITTRQNRRTERPKPQCGTIAGYRAHRKNLHPACPQCSAAWSAYMTVQHVKSGRTRTQRVPIEVLADLYLNANPEAMERVEAVLGDPLLNAIVHHYDEMGSGVAS